MSDLVAPEFPYDRAIAKTLEFSSDLSNLVLALEGHHDELALDVIGDLSANLLMMGLVLKAKLDVDAQVVLERQRRAITVNSVEASDVDSLLAEAERAIRPSEEGS